MLLWLKFPFFLFRVSILLLVLILRFIGFKLGQRSLAIANFTLLLIVLGLGYYYAFYPPPTSALSQPSEDISLNLEAIKQESSLTQKLTMEEANLKLISLEEKHNQQLQESPTLIPQKTYLNLAILAHYAGDNEKASRYLKLARFTDPNNQYFK